MTTISKNFKRDTKGTATNIKPVILLVNNEPGQPPTIADAFSTSVIRLTWEDSTIVSKEILATISSVKNSIDIENKKIKTNLFRFSLYDYSHINKKLTDSAEYSIIGGTNPEISLMGKRILLLYKTQSSTTINLDFKENELESSDCSVVFDGLITRVTIGEDTIRVQAEDPSLTLIKTSEIPKIMPSGKVYPMVYGKVDKSPGVVDGLKLIHDRLEMYGTYSTHPFPYHPKFSQYEQPIEPKTYIKDGEDWLYLDGKAKTISLPSVERNYSLYPQSTNYDVPYIQSATSNESTIRAYGYIYPTGARTKNNFQHGTLDTADYITSLATMSYADMEEPTVMHKFLFNGGHPRRWYSGDEMPSAPLHGDVQHGFAFHPTAGGVPEYTGQGRWLLLDFPKEVEIIQILSSVKLQSSTPWDWDLYMVPIDESVWGSITAESDVDAIISGGFDDLIDVTRDKIGTRIRVPAVSDNVGKVAYRNGYWTNYFSGDHNNDLYPVWDGSDIPSTGVKSSKILIFDWFDRDISETFGESETDGYGYADGHSKLKDVAAMYSKTFTNPNELQLYSSLKGRKDYSCTEALDRYEDIVLSQVSSPTWHDIRNGFLNANETDASNYNGQIAYYFENYKELIGTLQGQTDWIIQDVPDYITEYAGESALYASRWPLQIAKIMVKKFMAHITMVYFSTETINGKPPGHFVYNQEDYDYDDYDNLATPNPNFIDNWISTRRIFPYSETDGDGAGFASSSEMKQVIWDRYQEEISWLFKMITNTFFFKPDAPHYYHDISEYNNMIQTWSQGATWIEDNPIEILDFDPTGDQAAPNFIVSSMLLWIVTMLENNYKNLAKCMLNLNSDGARKSIYQIFDDGLSTGTSYFISMGTSTSYINAVLSMENELPVGVIEALPYETDGFIEKPSDIILHIISKEVSWGSGAYGALDLEKYDLNSFKKSREAYENWRMGFAINERVKTHELLEKFLKETKSFYVFNTQNKFTLLTIQDDYKYEDIKRFIDEKEVMNYSISRTKRENVVRSATCSYMYDNGLKTYTMTLPNISAEDLYPSWDEDYYGLWNSGSSASWDKIIDLRYHNNKDTAEQFANFYVRNNCNQHLIIDFDISLSYADLSVGDIIHIPLMNKAKAFGIDYSNFDTLNGQLLLPIWLIIAVNYNVDKISIKAYQLHLLKAGNVSELSLEHPEVVYEAPEEEEEIITEDVPEEFEETFEQTIYGNWEEFHTPALGTGYSLDGYHNWNWEGNTLNPAMSGVPEQPDDVPGVRQFIQVGPEEEQCVGNYYDIQNDGITNVVDIVNMASILLDDEEYNIYMSTDKAWILESLRNYDGANRSFLETPREVSVVDVVAIVGIVLGPIDE